MDPLSNLGKGLHRYVNDLDTGKKETDINCISREIEPIISKYLGFNLLDVGCGNGRLNAIWVRYSTRIVGIDIYREPNPLLVFDKFTFEKKTIFNVNGKFDTIVFYGSFYLHWKLGYLHTLKKAHDLLFFDGSVIIVDDHRRLTDKPKKGYYSMDIIKKAGLWVVVNKIQENGEHRVLILKKQINKNGY